MIAELCDPSKLGEGLDSFDIIASFCVLNLRSLVHASFRNINLVILFAHRILTSMLSGPDNRIFVTLMKFYSEYLDGASGFGMKRSGKIELHLTNVTRYWTLWTVYS